MRFAVAAIEDLRDQPGGVGLERLAPCGRGGVRREDRHPGEVEDADPAHLPGAVQGGEAVRHRVLAVVLADDEGGHRRLAGEVGQEVELLLDHPPQGRGVAVHLVAQALLLQVDEEGPRGPPDHRRGAGDGEQEHGDDQRPEDVAEGTGARLHRGAQSERTRVPSAAKRVMHRSSGPSASWLSGRSGRYGAKGAR